MMSVHEEWDVDGLFASDPASLSRAFNPSYSTSVTASYLSEFDSPFSEGFAQSSLYSYELPPSDQNFSRDYSVTGDPSLLCINDSKGRPGVRIKDVKRPRSQNWSTEEKHIYLEAKVEALRAVKSSPDWEFVSQRLHAHNFIRTSKSCEDLWGTLRKDFKAIREHESSKCGSSTSEWMSYWELDEDGRSRNKQPRLFPLEWCKMIERILAAQDKRRVDGSQRKTRGRLEQKSFGDKGHEYSFFQYPTNLSEDGSNQQTLAGERQRMADWGGTSCTSRKGCGAMMEEDAQPVILEPLAPRIKQQVEEEVNSALESLPCRKTSGDTTEQDRLMTSIAPLVKHHVEAAVIHALRLLAITRTIIGEDDSITRLAPNFIRKQIKDALDSALHPVSSALQLLGQKEQEDQARLQAIAVKRRALDREKKQIERQRVGRHHRTSRTSTYMQQGTRVKNSGSSEVQKGFNRAERNQDELSEDA